MSFSSDLRRYSEHLNKSLEDVASLVCYKASELIINKTPVDKGGARANWVATINRSSNRIIKTKDKKGTKALARARKVSESASGNIFYLTNNLDYIRVLEYGGYPKSVKRGTRIKGGKFVKYEVRSVGGYSHQAPRGMVRLSMIELRAYLRKFR